jgi:hypothetical protein
MPIKFLCPSGHPLSAPENRAGRPGKCPKCGTPFVIPAPDEEQPAENRAGESPVEPPAKSQAKEIPAVDQGPAAEIGQGSSKGKLSPADTFFFLCPNGHKLNGPSSIRGKAGQCPHCGAKFRIPSVDDELELPEVPDESAAGSEQFVFPGFESSENPDEVYEAVEVDDTLDPPPDGIHPLSYIVGRLWDRKGDGTELEIFLAEGEIVSPEFYSEILSIKEFGVFGSQDGDGTYSVTIIPWSTVRKINIRKLPELSDKDFR